MTIQELQNLPLERLQNYMEKYPFSAIFPVIIAKKQKDNEGENLEAYTTAASLRVPSRIAFRNYMNSDLNIDHSSESTQDGKLTYDEAKEIASHLKKPYALPLMHAQTLDIGEIIIENSTKFYRVSNEEFVFKEIVVEGNNKVISVRRDSFEEAKSKVAPVNYAQPLKQAHEVDEGEIVLDNPTTKKLPIIEELSNKEVVIDGLDHFVAPVIEQDTKSKSVLPISFSEAKSKVAPVNYAQPLKQAHEVDEGEIVLDNPTTKKLPIIEELSNKEVVVDGLDHFVAPVVTKDKEEKFVSFAGYGNNPYISQQRDLEDFNFQPINDTDLALEDDLVDEIGDHLIFEDTTSPQFNNDNSLRKIELPIEDDLIDEIWDGLIVSGDDFGTQPNNEDSLRKIQLPVEDDLVEEIGDELIVNEEIEERIQQVNTNNNLDTAPVSSLSADDEDSSMYKKIVNLLKEETQETNSKKPEIVLDVDFNSLEEQLEEKRIEQSVEKIVEEKADELETLYAQAAYEAELEKEIQIDEVINDKSLEKIEETKVLEIALDKKDKELIDKKEENHPTFMTMQIADNKQLHSFSGWFDQLSKMGAEFVSHQKEKIEQRPIKPIEEPIGDIEKPDISTKEVQEMARKSTVPSKSFYTETLAYVYELQEKWSRAIEVYEQLSLQNPQKSSYFAGRIKLLKEKLK